ncbi:MAG: ADP-ribosylglycohydrolase family protein [Planctomycetota bacterium]
MAETAEDLLQLLKDELRELSELGCETWEMERRAGLIEEEAGRDRMEKLRSLYQTLQGLEPAADFPYQEPSTLEEIRELRPDGPRRLAVPLREEALDDRTLGAWLGRAAGCMLGKPVEGWSRDKIADMMSACGVEALRDYWPEPRRGSGFGEGVDRLLRGNLCRAERDDDLDYTIVGLRILQRHGPEFGPREVADFWLAHLPYHRTYTAERAAYRNLVNGLRPPESALRRNPYREWIGAQIRADAFGYACPGRPERAAEFAFRDACVSHVKNGIYGEMWVAAMLAAALVAEDVEKVVRLGLSEIPETCRLSEALEKVLDWRTEGVDAEEAVERIMDELGDYHRVHTINNAAIVAMALLWGDGDFGRTVGLAVEAGLDTDCNGATAGSVAGAMLGADAIPEHWTEPLNDEIDTIVAGESALTISGLARATRAVQQDLG